MNLEVLEEKKRASPRKILVKTKLLKRKYFDLPQIILQIKLSIKTEPFKRILNPTKI